MARNKNTEQQQDTGEQFPGMGGNTNDDPSALPSMLEYDGDDITDAPPPAPLPKGEYEVTINTAKVKMSQKGNEYVEVTMFVSPEEYPMDFQDGPPNGMNLVYRRIDASKNPTTGKLTPRAAYQIGRFMRTIGMQGSKTINVDEWADHKCRVVIDHRPGQNDPEVLYPEVVAVKPA